MPYSCIVVDDNLIDRDVYLMHLKKIKEINVLADFSNAFDALNFLTSNEVDIVFSDIEMPHFSGLELSRSLKTLPLFIFVTSHSEFAIDGFEANALDFIIKPASFERILKATKKAIDYLELKKNAQLMESNIDDFDSEEYFFIRENKGKTRLKYDDVVYFESMGDFSTIYTTNSKHTILTNLKSLDSQLPAAKFQRVHKQFIININHLVTIAQADLYLTGGAKIPVSLSSRQELLKRTEEKTLSRSKKLNR